MIKSFKCKEYKDCIVLNLEDFEYSKSPIPLYVAVYEGIYKLTNSDEVWKKIRTIRSPSLIISIGGFAFTIIVLILVFIVNIVPSIAELVNHTLFGVVLLDVMVIMLVMAIVGVAAYKIDVFMTVKSTTLVWELVAPWDEILYIDRDHRRIIGYDDMDFPANPGIIIEDWHVYLRSGGEIFIKNIYNSDKKYKDIINKFCTHC